MKKRISVLFILLLVFLFAACENELPQGTPRPMITQPTETPSPTPSPTPSLTPDPYRGIRETWLERRQVDNQRKNTPRKRQGSHYEFWDTPATGERKTLNAVEERILAGECVLLENGTELDLDGNGTREVIRFGAGKDQVGLQIGAYKGTTEYEMWFTGRIFGVCLDEANPSQIHVAVEYTNQYNEEAPKKVSYDFFTYLQAEEWLYVNQSRGYDFSNGFGTIRFSPENWNGIPEKNIFAVDGRECLYGFWVTDGEPVCSFLQIPEGLKGVNQMAVVTADLFSCDEVTKERYCYVPAGSRVIIVAQNDEWLYLADCDTTAYAWVKLERNGAQVTVDAPYEISLEEALRYEED